MADDDLVRRLRASSVLVDARHRPHWLQETIDLAADRIQSDRKRIAELEAEVERRNRKLAQKKFC